MPTVIEGNIEVLNRNGSNIFPVSTPRAIVEEGGGRNLLDMLDELSEVANRIPTAAEIGARPDTWMPTAEDVGARPDSWTPNATEVGARPSDWMPTAADVGAASLSQVYPVGSIYLSVNDTSPASLFGGTWAQLKDRFLIGAGDSYTNGSTGGSATHTLTVAQLPSHNHKSGRGWRSVAQGTAGIQCISNTEITGDGWSGNQTSSTGSGQAHNNMPPYLAVYMWKRTA